jgi:hypothetical protein
MSARQSGVCGSYEKRLLISSGSSALEIWRGKTMTSSRLQCLAFIAVVFVAVFRGHSQGYLVNGGITHSTAGLSAVIHVLQDPASGDYSGVIWRPRFKTPGSEFYTIFSLDPGAADEGVRTFFASPNDPLTVQAIEAHSYPELVLGSLYGFDTGALFYLGFYTGYTNGMPPGVYSEPVFGWGRFVNNQGMIEMLDSALAMESGGIYVGTQTIIPVPEPEARFLWGSLVFLAVFFRNQADAHLRGRCSSG